MITMIYIGHIDQVMLQILKKCRADKMKYMENNLMKMGLSLGLLFIYKLVIYTDFSFYSKNQRQHRPKLINICAK